MQTFPVFSCSPVHIYLGVNSIPHNGTKWTHFVKNTHTHGNILQACAVPLLTTGSSLWLRAWIIFPGRPEAWLRLFYTVEGDCLAVPHTSTDDFLRLGPPSFSAFKIPCLVELACHVAFKLWAKLGILPTWSTAFFCNMYFYSSPHTHTCPCSGRAWRSQQESEKRRQRKRTLKPQLKY